MYDRKWSKIELSVIIDLIYSYLTLDPLRNNLIFPKNSLYTSIKHLIIFIYLKLLRNPSHFNFTHSTFLIIFYLIKEFLREWSYCILWEITIHHSQNVHMLPKQSHTKSILIFFITKQHHSFVINHWVC